MKCLFCGEKAERHVDWWSCTVCGFEWGIRDGIFSYYNLEGITWCDVPEGCLPVFNEKEL